MKLGLFCQHGMKAAIEIFRCTKQLHIEILLRCHFVFSNHISSSLMHLLEKAAGREKSAPQFHFHGFSLFTDRLCARDSWTVMIVRISLGLCLTPTTLEYCGRRWLHPLSIHWAAFIFGGAGGLEAQVQKFPGWNVLSPFRGKGGPALSGFLSVQVIMIVTQKHSVLHFFFFFFDNFSNTFSNISQEGGEAFCRLKTSSQSFKA